MRKLLSFTLAFCLLLSAFVCMTSCDKVSEKKMEKDPISVLSNAMESSTSQFFADTANVGPTVAKAMKNGSLSISLEAELLEEFNVGKITETLYMNQKDKKYVSDTLVNFNGEDLTARIFLDDKGLVINSQAVLGSDLSYAISPATLAEKFAGSSLAKSIGVTDKETVDQVNEVLSSVADAYKKMFESNKKDAKELENKLLDILNITVSEQALPVEGATSADCVVASCNFTNETYEAYLRLIMDEIKLDNEELSASLDEAMDSMMDEMDIDLKINVFVSKKTGLCEMITIKGSFSEDSMEAPVEIDASVTFSKTAIKVSAQVTADGEVVTVAADLTKEESKDGVTYQLVAKAKQSGTSIILADLTAAYTKGSGDFTITADIPELIEEDVVVKGKIVSDKNSATVSINSIKYDNVEVELKLDMTFNATAKIPETPANVKDVVDLTDKDIEKLMEDFQSSKLGALIFGFSGDAYEDEYYAA